LQYRINDNITLNGRINNLLDEDFTSYKYTFTDLNDDGDYEDDDELVYTDDYNNKDKARSYWVSVNVRF
jgi:outer membrane receptor for ferrienterochelin and colicins